MGNNVLKAYLEEIGEIEPLAPEKEIELAIEIRKGNEKALEELVKHNLRFVVSVAKKYQGNGLLLADLIQEGNKGLLKAAKRYDPSRGFKFISYAVWWIRQGILESLAYDTRVVRLPLNRVAAITKTRDAIDEYQTINDGQFPSYEHLAKELGVSEKDILEVFQNQKKAASFDKSFDDEDDNTLYDVIHEENTPKPSHTMDNISLKGDLEISLSKLDRRERNIVEMYFGVNGYENKKMTLNEIGEIYGLTRERIRQIKAKAMKKLSHKVNSKHLIKYLGQ
ncbi:MAG: RNA polymerase sigma factor RpoD/SigA [archaeon]